MKKNSKSLSGKMQHFYPVMPLNPELAHAYVPYQYMTNIYPPKKGLSRGTIFPCLYRPYGYDPEYTLDA
ncbi:MAG: spore coat associated protein CotJA [Acetivibrionales bacterium]|jgi:hypothetical protein